MNELWFDYWLLSVNILEEMAMFYQLHAILYIESTELQLELHDHHC